MYADEIVHVQQLPVKVKEQTSAAMRGSTSLLMDGLEQEVVVLLVSSTINSWRVIM